MSQNDRVTRSAPCHDNSVTPSHPIYAAVVAAHDGGVSYRALCRQLGLPASDFALLAKIARGKSVSETTLRRIGHALGITSPPRIEVDPCPDCGSVHHGRCHGKPVALRPIRRRRITRWADAPVSVLAAAIRQRQTV